LFQASADNVFVSQIGFSLIDPVPIVSVPTAVWFFVSAMAGLIVLGRRKIKTAG
jgi:hypothetical protein